MKIRDFFRRKYGGAGNGSEKTVTLSKMFEPLNYGPIPYEFSDEFLNYIKSAPDEFKRRATKTNIDDLNFDMFDPGIDSRISRELVVAEQQFTYHIGTIEHNHGIVEGLFTAAEEHLKVLENEKTAIERELENLIRKREVLEKGGNNNAKA